MNTVPAINKLQWPGFITDALGIPSVQGSAGPWCSSGSTVDKVWFQAICDYLGVAYPGDRISAMRLILEAVGVRWDESRHSSKGEAKADGGNVRKEALEDLWDALHTSGRLVGRDAPTKTADEFAAGLTGGELPEPQFTYQRIRLRQGQAVFRLALLAAYEGRCAISDVDVTETLEAAHIVPHTKGGQMVVSNGILLRADLHTLFDLRLIAIDTTEWRVRVHPHIARSESWWREWLANRPFRLPTDPRFHPDRRSLDEHLSASFSRRPPAL